MEEGKEGNGGMCVCKTRGKNKTEKREEEMKEKKGEKGVIGVVV